MKNLIFALLITVSSCAQVINCPSGFNTTTSAACSVGASGGSTNDFFSNIAQQSLGTLNGTKAILVPVGAGHAGWGVIRQTKVNVQAFTAHFQWIPNGYNFAFVLENQSNQNGAQFNAGAGSEGGFYQGAGNGNIAPDHVFAISYDSYQGTTSQTYNGSNTQWYQTLQTPQRPPNNVSGSLAGFQTNQALTSPVQLSSPSTTQASPSTDTFDVTVTYNHGDGTMTVNMFDVTTGGTCSPITSGTCSHQAYTGVWIPEIVGASTAWVGFAGGTGLTTAVEQDLVNFTYTVNSQSGSPTFTAYNANSTFNTGSVSSASPVFSVAPGSYSGTQTVTITTATTPNNYICYTLASSAPAAFPYPDNNGGCSVGTKYTTPVSIASTATLYATAGPSNQAFGTASANPSGYGPPSTIVAATYTIGGTPTPSGTTLSTNSALTGGTLQ